MHPFMRTRFVAMLTCIRAVIYMTDGMDYLVFTQNSTLHGCNDVHAYIMTSYHALASFSG